MTPLNWCLLGLLIVCVIVVCVVVHRVRQKTKSLDGIYGIQEADITNIEIPVEQKNERLDE